MFCCLRIMANILGFHDSEYDSRVGVKTFTNEKEILVKSDVIIQLRITFI